MHKKWLFQAFVLSHKSMLRPSPFIWKFSVAVGSQILSSVARIWTHFVAVLLFYKTKKFSGLSAPIYRQEDLWVTPRPPKSTNCFSGGRGSTHRTEGCIHWIFRGLGPPIDQPHNTSRYFGEAGKWDTFVSSEVEVAKA